MAAGLLGIFGFGGALGTIMAATVPTSAEITHTTSETAAAPEDYPELVGVSYESTSGPYFAPKAYSGIAPIIRDNVYEISDHADYDADQNQDASGDEAPARWQEDELPPTSDTTYDIDIMEGSEHRVL